MVVVFKLRPWDAEQRPAGDELKKEAAKAPDIKGFVDSTSKNQLRGSKATRSDRFCGWVGEEVGCHGI